MNILLIGSGGREHALAWKLADSHQVKRVFVAPGNAGTARESKVHNLPITNHQELIKFCQQENIAFTVVGPEAPLASGIVDDFQAAGLKIFGPTQAAAQLESSKDFAKAFMARHHIPTAAYQTFTDAQKAHHYVDEHGAPIVIKADGLAAGKGVVVAMTLNEAHQAIDDMLLSQAMGEAGARVVIEDFLMGEEASFIVMVDGEHVLPMATSQDHKRLLDNDMGPNTGGMGAYSPAPVVTELVYRRAMERIILPTVKAMAAEGHPFVGFLYAGLMITPEGDPYTVEFNCRFGDPETQPVLSRLQSDLVDLIQNALDGKLHQTLIGWDSRYAVGVVLAAEGYPQKPRKGDEITGIDEANQTGKIFYAGVREENGKCLTDGGRVLCAVGLGHGLAEAQKNAYATLEKIHFSGMQYRQDIGNKALNHSH